MDDLARRKGKQTLKEVALSVQKTEPDMHLLILLIDERPEEVTDIKEAIEGPNVEVIYSTFDELPEHHKRVSEMLIARAKRLVEHGRDVMILLDSITRLSRAYNLTVPPSGRTLSGGLDPAALYSPKRFFGAARKMREGGSLTILATALVETGSKMDDVVYEEFKGTGNMELMLDRKLQEKRVFPAIDIPRSGTRREDLLLNKEEQEASYIIRKALNGMKAEEAADNLINMFSRTKSNAELVQQVIRQITVANKIAKRNSLVIRFSRLFRDYNLFEIEKDVSESIRNDQATALHRGNNICNSSTKKNIHAGIVAIRFQTAERRGRAV